jgi:hypothetical protein
MPSAWAEPSSTSACPVEASTESPAAVSSPIRAAGSRAGTTGRWNTLPAEARIALAFHGSAASPATMTPSAPAASASRITVPVLPGSLVCTSTATSLGEPASRSATEVVGNAQRTTRPCGLTASLSEAAPRSVTWVTVIPAA